MNLQECRDELDIIDRQIVELFQQRMKVCGNVAEYKISIGKEVYDGTREQQKLNTLADYADGDFNKCAVRELFSQIMTISRRYQYTLMPVQETKEEPVAFDVKRVVYQGVEGAYSHAATLQYFGREIDAYHVTTFAEAMEEVESGRASYAVLPLDNSTAGAVIDNYDLIVKYQNHIVGELFLPVCHTLLGTQEAQLSDIKTVYSHPQALMQCSTYLNGNKEWNQVSLENTAVSAMKIVTDGDVTQAAVASEIAGELYGLKILKESIQNNQKNTTRFIILSKYANYEDEAKKISLCFELPHRSGSLHNILGHFIFNGVNMQKIESRPIEGKNWEYRFFVDIEGNLNDSAIKNALRGIEAEAQNMRVLGNY